MRKKRIGIYGGTFAPPHKGHVKAAKHFIKCARLDELLITVTYTPPHKQVKGDADPYQRLEMARLAFGKIKKAVVSDYEIEKKGVSYTKDTLRHFKTEENELFLLVGDDMFLTLDEWKAPDEIFALCTVVCFPRDDDGQIPEKIQAKKKEYEEKFSARIMTPVYPVYEMSSTEIRDDVKNGRSIAKKVPKEVREYIDEHGLYRA